MIVTLLVFTISDLTIIVLIVALGGIGYLQFKNSKYRLAIKTLKANNLVLEQQLAIKDEET